MQTERHDKSDGPQHQTAKVYELEAKDSIRLNRLPYAIRYRISEFTGAEFKVWMAHLSHAHNKDKRSFAGVELLMNETGLSENGIKNAHAGLVRKRWITRYRAADSQTGERTTSTTFCKWPPPVPGTLYERWVRRRGQPEATS